MKVDPLPEVSADPLQMMQLFQHLIGNAVKFHGDKAPAVEVDSRRENGHWIISVTDNGIGIDKEQGERIFELMKRLHLREHYPGTGIGLPMCRRIVERHGGHIWFEPNPKGGSVFRFTMPARVGVNFPWAARASSGAIWLVCFRQFPQALEKDCRGAKRWRSLPDGNFCIRCFSRKNGWHSTCSRSRCLRPCGRE